MSPTTILELIDCVKAVVNAIVLLRQIVVNHYGETANQEAEDEDGDVDLEAGNEDCAEHYQLVDEEMAAWASP
ncbi:hypothetical protein ABW21_db0209087 [Orbilia brochopaga]|nr:hypothetical protein ABW21_db0209087 [Drechslerella brochopaga]